MNEARRSEFLFRLRLVGSVVLLLLACVYWADLLGARDAFDDVFLAILAAALLLIAVPWDRLHTLKAGPLELSLDQPAIRDTLSRINLTDEERQQLEDSLRKKVGDFEKLQGSRILWIDDNPFALVGERRLLRSLGFQITTAHSSEVAEEILESDPDYDLIVTDVQRVGDSYKLNQGVSIHEGANFVAKLHTTAYKPDDEAMRDLVQSIPVIFYAGYDMPQLIEFTKPARAVCIEVDICNDFFSLLDKIVFRLAEVRARRTPYWISALGGSKMPTRPR